MTDLDFSEGESAVVSYDADTDTYRARHDFTGPRTLSTTLVLTLEAVDENAEATARPFYEYTDPDAIDSLFCPTRRSPRDRGWVSFSVGSFAVIVHADGEIVLTQSQTKPSNSE